MCHVNDDYNEGYERGHAEGATPKSVWLVWIDRGELAAVCATREFAESVMAEFMIGSRQPNTHYISEHMVQAKWETPTWTPK